MEIGKCHKAMEKVVRVGTSLSFTIFPQARYLPVQCNLNLDPTLDREGSFESSSPTLREAILNALLPATL